MTRWKQTKVDERSELASKFFDSLRSEAYIIAEDLGTDILFSNDNIPKVVEAVRERLFPLVEQGVKGAVPLRYAGRRCAVAPSWRAYGFLYR